MGVASCRVRLCGRVGGVAWYRGCSPLGAQLAVGDELIEDVEGALAYNEKEVWGGELRDLGPKWWGIGGAMPRYGTRASGDGTVIRTNYRC